MSIEFLFHLSISAIIFFVICSGFKFFLKIASILDFSYIGVVIFAAYFWFYLNIEYGFGLLWCILLSFLASIPILLFLLYVSSKLEGVYFLIGTLAIYMLILKMATGLESITWGVFGLSIASQHIIGNLSFWWIQSFMMWYTLFFVWVSVWLWYIRHSFFYSVLQGWGENVSCLKSIGYRVNIYKLCMILITACLASIWGNMYGYYNAYIDPGSFWLVLLNLILIISFISYKFQSIWTLLCAFFIILSYEYVRFFKFVDPAQIGYMREMLFGCIVMWSAYIVFKYTKLGREL